jgi:hypothetical protein
MRLKSDQQVREWTGERYLGQPSDEKTARGNHYPFVADLERSHTELRAALILAGQEIRRLNFGRRDNPVLNKLREVMRDARKVAAEERKNARFRIKLAAGSS